VLTVAVRSPYSPSHGLPADALHVVFQATVANKLLYMYASPASWGFASADDRNRLEGFLQRSAKFGYRATSTTLASMCADADDQLLAKVPCNTHHLLHDLLPPLREQHYSLRERSHNYCLPDRISTFMDKNFLIRILYKDLGCSQSCLTLHYHSYLYTSAVCLYFRTQTGLFPVDIYIFTIVYMSIIRLRFL